MASTRRDILVNALHATCDEMCKELTQIPLRYWNESVFRFYLVRRLQKISPNIDVECEWNRFDLAFKTPEGMVLVELKFWCYRGTAFQSKGGPSAQNFREYEQVLAKLRAVATQPLASTCGGVAAAFLILMYADPSDASSRSTFGKYYDNINADDIGGSVETIVDSIPCGSDTRLTCKLIEVAFSSAACRSTSPP